ncbi:MAG: hypothetical protein V4644_02230 [Patescibacteria group bacterium]
MATTPDPLDAPLPTPQSIASVGMKADLEDRSRFIRTMAKDMAALAGASLPVPQAPSMPATEATRETVAGVTLEKPQEPFFERWRSKKEDQAPEAVALPSMAEAGAIVSSDAPVPLIRKETRPMMPASMPTPEPLPPDRNEDRTAILERLRRNVSAQAPSTPIPVLMPEPVTPPPAPEPVQPAVLRPQAPAPLPRTIPEPEPPPRIYPDALAELHRRQAVEAARLKAAAPPAQLKPEVPVPAPKLPPVQAFSPKLVAPVPVPVPPPTPPRTPDPVPALSWMNIPAPKPAFTPDPVPAPPRIPPVAKESYREPIEQPPTPIPAASRGPEPLHTYTSDFGDRIDSRNASTFSVLAAEQDSRRTSVPALPVRSRFPMKAAVAVVSGIFLLALAGGGIFATYRFVMTMRDTPIASLIVPTIVFADEFRELAGTGGALIGLLAEAADEPLVSGNVLVTYILATTGDEETGIVTGPSGGAAFVRALRVPAPDILLRNISDESTVGAISAGGDTNAFFALRVDSFERTYAGMLTWEPLMARDLALLYPLYPAREAAVEPLPVAATSTASTTVPALTRTPVQATARTRFEDAIVANYDVRVLRDTDGKTLILYGYADKRTLLIVRDEAAFEALLARLKNE